MCRFVNCCRCIHVSSMWPEVGCKYPYEITDVFCRYFDVSISMPILHWKIENSNQFVSKDFGKKYSYHISVAT